MATQKAQIDNPLDLLVKIAATRLDPYEGKGVRRARILIFRLGGETRVFALHYSTIDNSLK